MAFDATSAASSCGNAALGCNSAGDARLCQTTTTMSDKTVVANDRIPATTTQGASTYPVDVNNFFDREACCSGVSYALAGASSSYDVWGCYSMTWRDDTTPSTYPTDCIPSISFPSSPFQNLKYGTISFDSKCFSNLMGSVWSDNMVVTCENDPNFCSAPALDSKKFTSGIADCTNGDVEALALAAGTTLTGTAG